jgi:hypothetical protein
VIPIFFYLWYLSIPLTALYYVWTTGHERKTKLVWTGILIAVLVLFTALNAHAHRTPKLTIASPENNASVQAHTVTIQGTVSPSTSTVKVNDTAADVDAKTGSFSSVFFIPSDTNTAIVTATNSGKSVSTTLTITRLYTDQEKSDMAAAALKAQQDAAAADAKAKADEAAYENGPAGKLCKKHTDWTRDDCEGVAKRQYWIGMTIDMLKATRGTPNNANPSNYGGDTQWQWCWTDYTPSCFYGGDDGIITSYN